MARGNHFINRFMDTKEEARHTARGKAEANREANTKPSAEPSFPNFELSLETGLACTKCLPTKYGSKLCRVFMGTNFKVIRQRRALRE